MKKRLFDDIDFEFNEESGFAKFQSYHFRFSLSLYDILFLNLEQNYITFYFNGVERNYNLATRDNAVAVYEEITKILLKTKNNVTGNSKVRKVKF